MISWSHLTTLVVSMENHFLGITIEIWLYMWRCNWIMLIIIWDLTMLAKRNNSVKIGLDLWLITMQLSRNLKGSIYSSRRLCATIGTLPTMPPTLQHSLSSFCPNKLSSQLIYFFKKWTLTCHGISTYVQILPTFQGVVQDAQCKAINERFFHVWQKSSSQSECKADYLKKIEPQIQVKSNDQTFFWQLFEICFPKKQYINWSHYGKLSSYNFTCIYN